ncbi:MAG: MFS transporter [Oscillospiraceae bacterium]|jgi:Na+/melibiose symporter-like transporter|nr:MFS transporter [Oscillospiraceae bacterium]
MKRLALKEKIGEGGRLLSYAAGNMLGGGSQMITSLYYLNFLIFAMQLPPLLAGLVTGISKVWDGIIDPVLGVAVDRTKTRWGACRPWLLASVLPVFVAYIMLWNHWGIQSTAGRFAYFLFASILFSTAASVGTVPYEALLPRMIESYDARASYSVLRSLLAGMTNALSVWVFEAMVTIKETADYTTQIPNFSRMGTVLGLIFAAAPLITFLGSKEKAKLFVPESVSFSGVFRQYGRLLRSRIYRRTLFLNIAGSFVSYCCTAVQIIFILLVFNNLNFKIPIAGVTFSLVFLAVNWEGAWEVMSFFTSTLLMTKGGKHAPFKLNFPFHIVGNLLFLFITKSTPLWFFFVALAMSGFGASCISFIPSCLLPDLPDVEEAISGKQLEGSMAGLLNLGRQLAQGLAFLLSGALLGAFGLSEENATPALGAGLPLMSVKILYAVIPVLCGVAMWAFSRRWPLSAERLAMIQTKVAQKRSEGVAVLSPEERTALQEVTGLPTEELWLARTQ